MLWYLIICGADPFKSACAFSPPFESAAQCRFVQEQVPGSQNSRCVGVRKP